MSPPDVFQVSSFSSRLASRYKHGVIPSLISSDLLRAVRSEIQENISFTPKETDIYRIHQSGDLANLDGLDDSSLKLLPSLLSLRDALYSPEFRTYLSSITGAGELSGKKTDMAVNVYIPGCHLLCHDDVIGTRRVSYILYLTNPDEPWKDEWGGALRLYPTLELKAETEGGKLYKIPSPDESVRIPPAFGQLSFFAVQPGESFHDVEEVYAAEGEGGNNGVENSKRVRMAISGWYHIPQEGEEGYEPGLEEKLAEKSSLVQLQGKADQYDLPQPATTVYQSVSDLPNESTGQAEQLPAKEPMDDESLSESDLTFLLDYLAPTYLTPDTLDSVAAAFTDQFSLVLDNILSRKFSDSLRTHILDQEGQPLPAASIDIESKTPWKVARPPHKHRFLYQQIESVSAPQTPGSGLQTPPASFSHPATDTAADDSEDMSPVQDLLTNLLPSTAFKKWLQLATSQTLLSHNLLCRRFRKGKDYTLATGYDDESPRLEITLAVTPTKGWGDDEAVEAQESEAKAKPKAQEGNQKEDEADESEAQANPKAQEGNQKEDEAEELEDKANPKAQEGKQKENKAEPATLTEATSIPDPTEPGEATVVPEPQTDPPSVGGYLAYMAGDDEDPTPSEPESDSGIEVPPSLSTGARSTEPAPAPASKPKKSANSDPAIYKAATDDPEDDGVLFSMPAGWNRLGIVLRDRGTMRFVKYVSRAAGGDRWDFVGEFGVGDGGEEEEGDEEEKEEQGQGQGPALGVDEEETEVEVLESASDESSD